jgi:hypothetical protein
MDIYIDTPAKVYKKDDTVLSVVGDKTVSPEMVYAIGIAGQAYAKYKYDCILTSLLDGKHNCGSLHPEGKAADIRSKNMPVNVAMHVFEELKTFLSPIGFDVVWEGAKGATPATTAMHIHIEFDPKGRTFERKEWPSV